MKLVRYTDEEKAFVRKMAGKANATRIAALMQAQGISPEGVTRSAATVRQMAHQMGVSLRLHRPKKPIKPKGPHPFGPAKRLTTPVPKGREQEYAEKLEAVRGGCYLSKQDTLLLAIDVAAEVADATG